MALTQVTEKKRSFILDADADRLERQAAQYIGAEDCVLVEKAFDGIAMALGICGVGEGDSVLCTPLGHSSIARAIRQLGARPVFVDINPNNFNLDPFCMDYVLRKCIREKTQLPKVLIATGLFGFPCNYEALSELCQRYGIDMIEDMGSGFGAEYKGVRLGSIGRFAVSSFFDLNNQGEWGSDGAVFCRSRKDGAVLRAMRGDGAVQQILNGDWRPETDEGQAQNLLIEKKLECYSGDAERRRKIAGWYRKRLAGQVRMQEPSDGYLSAYTQFAVALKDEESRRAVIKALNAEQIPCTIYCPLPLHKRIGQDDWNRIILVNAEQACRKLLLLPMHPYLSENVVSYICDCVTRAM